MYSIGISGSAIVRVWLMAALFGVLTPFLILGLWQYLPAVGHIFSPRPLQVNYIPFMLLEYRLQGAALLYTAAMSFVYWGIGLLLYARSVYLLCALDLRTATADILFSISVAFLFFVVPLLFTILTLAFSNSVLPFENWGVSRGNHGPWRSLLDLRYLLFLTFKIPMLSYIAALVSLIIKRSIRACYALVASFAVFVLLLLTFYWLVD